MTGRQHDRDVPARDRDDVAPTPADVNAVSQRAIDALAGRRRSPQPVRPRFRRCRARPPADALESAISRPRSVVGSATIVRDRISCRRCLTVGGSRCSRHPAGAQRSIDLIRLPGYQWESRQVGGGYGLVELEAQRRQLFTVDRAADGPGRVADQGPEPLGSAADPVAPGRADRQPDV